MKTQVLDIKGNTVEEIDLNEKVFGLIPNKHVLNLYVRIFLTNQRQGNSKVKDRSEVSGSGKKPWAQKGTGRARAGQKRSPIWRHGGITHGPSTKSWSIDLPKKVRQLALKSALSLKFKDNKMLVLDKIKLDSPKTKEIVEILANLKARGNTLLVLDSVDNALIKSCANLKNVNTTFVDNLNAFELVKSNKVLLTKGSINKLEEKYK